MEYLDLEDAEISKKLSEFVEHPHYSKLYRTWVDAVISAPIKHMADNIFEILPYELVETNEDSQVRISPEMENDIFREGISKKDWNWYVVPNQCLVNCALILYPFLKIMYPKRQWYILHQSYHTIISSNREVYEVTKNYTGDTGKDVIVSIEDHYLRKHLTDWGTGYFLENNKNTQVYETWDDVKKLLKTYNIDLRLLDDVKF